ncbi:MAG TPA: carboxypeptidase regulatory-like domain-containing protein [Bryobacteraceae bacterium]|nr:carboxypeptidase regulatory-like domain-containing protein [Bryobacteraceae bacterium]
MAIKMWIQISLMAVLSATALFAQLDTGTITIVVRDASGSVVPGAAVTLRNENTGVEARTGATNEQGVLTAALIPSGSYSVHVEMRGFKSYQRAGIYLQVNEQLSIPVTLQVGEIAEQVVVTGTAALVEATTGTLRETIDRVRVSELPLNGRNVLQLQILVPGSVSAGSLDQGAGTPGYAINGGIGGSNMYSLDGGEYQDSYFNAPLPFPNPDAIQEFTIQTNSYSAEFGRNRGASINAVTKSGTNDFHGGAFEFVRNDAFDARPFFSTGAPAFKRNQFGAQLGGPIRRNKTFFFGAWQGTHERGTPSTSTATVLSSAMRAGNFSQLSKPIIDPLTKAPFPGNIIPADRLSKPAVNFLNKFVPLPNLGNNYVTPLPAPKDGNQYLVRIDHELSQNDRIYGRYIYNDDSLFSAAGNLPNWGIDQTFHRQGVVLSHTHLFSPTLVNSAVFSFNRVYSYIVQTPDFMWSDLGANIPPASPVTHSWQNLTISGYFSAITGTFWDLARKTYNISDSLSWIRGRHSAKFGAQISRYHVDQVNEFYSRFGGTFNGFATGDAAADFMLGNLNQFREVSVLGNNLTQVNWQFFASDEVKVSPRLTLTAGLRWQPDLHFTEANGKESAFRPGLRSSIYPNAPLGLLFKGDPQLPPNVINPNWKDFAPRFSFAYDLFGNGKTALRGGYGIFYDDFASIRLNRFPLIQPFVLDITVFDVPLADPFLGKSPFPFIAPSTPEEKRNFKFITPAATTSFNADFRTPYAQQWNFNLQQQLPFESVLTVAYVGSKSSRLFGSHNLNPAAYRPGATTSDTQARRIYQDFGTIEEESTVGYSQYHSLQATYNKRFSRGFTMLASYTFSKDIGLTSPQGEGSLGTRDPNNWNLDKGVMPTDRTHILAVSSVWMAPSPRTRNRLVTAAVGGWQLAGILTANSGAPLTVRAGVDRSLNGQNLDTADLVGDWKVNQSRSRGDEVQRWFNTAAFALPALGTVGTSGIDILRGPAMSNFDLAAYKNFQIAERFKFQFRAEFFNVLNHTVLGNPNTTLTNGNFGKILSTQTLPRIGELGLKLQF